MNTSCTSGQLQLQLRLFEDKGMTPARWTSILASGFFADLCDSDADLSDRFRFRDALGLNMVDRRVDPLPLKDDGTEYVVAHHGGDGMFHCDPKKIHLHTLKETLSLTGLEVYEELEDQPLLGGNELDFFLKNQYAIPEAWRGETIAFLATQYRLKMEWRFEDEERVRRAEGRPYEGKRFVRCLFYRGCERRWISFIAKLNDSWDPSWRIAMELTESPLFS